MYTRRSSGSICRSAGDAPAAGTLSIAAPPFGEGRRAEWLAERFRELKLEQVEIDAEGNVLGCYPGNRLLTGGPCVMLSAHIDTVFPIHTPIAPLVEHNRLAAPGACDNGAGVAGILAVAGGTGELRNRASL